MEELQVKLNRKNFKLEKDFTSVWGKALKKEWFYFDKISDWSIGFKKIDCYIWTNKKFYVCEVKMIANDIFKISSLRDNQYSSLKTNLMLWGTAESIVVVYSKKLDKYSIIPFSVIYLLNRQDSIKLTFKDAT